MKGDVQACGHPPLECEAQRIRLTNRGQTALWIRTSPAGWTGKLAGSSLRCRFRLIKHPFAPVVLILLERRRNGELEQLPIPLDIADLADFRALRMLSRQGSLAVHFTEDGALPQTRELALSAIDRLRLRAIIKQAIEHYRSIPPDLRNFELASRSVEQVWVTSG